METLVEQVENNQVGCRDHEQGECGQDQQAAQEASVAQGGQRHQAKQAGPQPGIGTERRYQETTAASGIGTNDRVDQPRACQEKQCRHEHDASIAMLWIASETRCVRDGREWLGVGCIGGSKGETDRIADLLSLPATHAPTRRSPDV